jgi:hypothetical protein
MDIVLDSDGALAFVENIRLYNELDPTDQAQFLEGAKRVLATQYMLEDVLRQAGVITEPLTDLAAAGRTRNPFYKPILAKAGDKP